MTIEKFTSEALEKLARCFRLLMQLPDTQENLDTSTDGSALNTQPTNDGGEAEGVILEGSHHYQ